MEMNPTWAQASPPALPTLLSCGRDEGTVAGHARAGNLDPHERQCSFCRAVAAGVAALIRASAALSAGTAGQVPAHSVVPAVMATVFSELRPGRRIPLPGSGGTLSVTESALCTALTAALADVATAVIRRCVITYFGAANGGAEQGEQGEHGEGGLGEGGLTVTVTAGIAFGSDTVAVGQIIRERVVRQSQVWFGLSVRQVDVQFTDLLVRGR